MFASSEGPTRLATEKEEGSKQIARKCICDSDLMHMFQETGFLHVNSLHVSPGYGRVRGCEARSTGVRGEGTGVRVYGGTFAPPRKLSYPPVSLVLLVRHLSSFQFDILPFLMFFVTYLL